MGLIVFSYMNRVIISPQYLLKQNVYWSYDFVLCGMGIHGVASFIPVYEQLQQTNKSHVNKYV